MKPISEMALAAAVALTGGAALAQDFTAGKTPAQLFGSDCSACHRSPRGLAKSRDVRELAAFLTEHYTTKPESAGALAAYVSGFAGVAAETRPRAGIAAPLPAAAVSDPARSAAKPVAEPRRRRVLEMSADGEKPARRHDEGVEPPRPPQSSAAPIPSATPRPP
jgi:hypothetical protein